MSFVVPYLVGSILGRSHIYWPTILRSEITHYTGLTPTTQEADSIWPVDVDIYQMMALAWRVKRWKLTGSGSVSDTTTSPGPVVTTGVGSFTVEAFLSMARTILDAETREIEIIESAIGGFGPFDNLLGNYGTVFMPRDQVYSTWDALLNGITPQNGTIAANPPANIGFYTPIYTDVLFDPVTSMFSPSFAGPGPLIAASFLGASAQTQKNPLTVLSGSGVGALKAPGTLTVIPGIADSFDIPLQLQWGLGHGVGSTWIGAGSATFTLEADEYWPF